MAETVASIPSSLPPISFESIPEPVPVKVAEPPQLSCWSSITLDPVELRKKQVRSLLLEASQVGIFILLQKTLSC